MIKKYLCKTDIDCSCYGWVNWVTEEKEIRCISIHKWSIQIISRVSLKRIRVRFKYWICNYLMFLLVAIEHIGILKLDTLTSILMKYQYQSYAKIHDEIIKVICILCNRH